MDPGLRRYEKYASVVRRMLLLAGLWPSHLSSRTFRAIALVHAVSCAIAAFGSIFFVLRHITSLDLVTRGFGVTMSFSTVLLKVTVFWINRARFVQLHETLEKTFRKDLSNAENRANLFSSLAVFHRPTVWLTTLTWTLLLLYNVSPLLSIVVQRRHGVRVLRYHTPFPTQYPIPESGAFFVACYLIEVAATLGSGSVSTGVDALFGFYIFQMTGQFRVLSSRMAGLTIDDDYRRVTKECVARRHILAQCRDKLQTIYGPIVLWMMTTNAISICMNIFQISQVNPDKMILYAVYIFTKLVQTFLYGWYGLLLTTESETFGQSIYRSGWPGCSDKIFLSNVLTMSMCRPLVLTACHMATISLNMFVTIVNTAVSYFFLLQSIDEK